MPRKAGYVYVEVDWELDGHSMRSAGVTRIVGIPIDEFNDRFNEPPEEWVADWLSDELGWLVKGWSFA